MPQHSGTAGLTWHLITKHGTWELEKLVEIGRLELDLGDVGFQIFLRMVTILPITIEIVRMSTELDFTSDPADEIIAATSIVEQSPLLTRDRRILRSRMVPRRS